MDYLVCGNFCTVSNGTVNVKPPVDLLYLRLLCPCAVCSVCDQGLSSENMRLSWTSLLGLLTPAALVPESVGGLVKNCHWCENSVLISFNNLSIHDHFIQYHVNSIQIEHNI